MSLKQVVFDIYADYFCAFLFLAANAIYSQRIKITMNQFCAFDIMMIIKGFFILHLTHKRDNNSIQFNNSKRRLQLLGCLMTQYGLHPRTESQSTRLQSTKTQKKCYTDEKIETELALRVSSITRLRCNSNRGLL